MAKKSTKRQQPSKPTTLRPSATPHVGTSSRKAPIVGDTTDEKQRQVSTATQDSQTARDLAPTHDIQQEHEALARGDRPRSKAEIEAGKKKGEYEVLTHGAIFDGKTQYKMGDTVTLTADEAAGHRERGVALAGPAE